ncbi:Thioredoxin domain-containing protein [Candidatus Terasakiella magnetica]|nr:Thioredoxin domain-containing protein [Candidatus Terasakiella magnetica]
MEMIINPAGKSQGSAKAGDAKDLIKDGSTATFMADVMEMSRKVPVVVDFWAPWCGPCKQLGPALEKAVRDAKGAVRMVKINVDENQDLAAQLRVQTVPMVYAFKDGRPVDAFSGAVPDSQVRQFIQRLAAGAGAGPSLDEYVAEARRILDEGDPQTAAGIFQQVLQEDPDSAPALAGLLRCLMALGDTEQAEAMLARVPPEMARHAEIAAIRTAIDLARHATEVGEAPELRRKLASNGDDHQSRFDLAMAYYGANEREAAVDELLELVRRDRTWNDEAARKQLIKFFDAFGQTHPLTKDARRRLSVLWLS